MKNIKYNKHDPQRASCAKVLYGSECDCTIQDTLKPFLLIEESKLYDTWYVELPSGFKGYIPTKALKSLFKSLGKVLV